MLENIKYDEGKETGEHFVSPARLGWSTQAMEGDGSLRKRVEDTAVPLPSSSIP